MNTKVNKTEDVMKNIKIPEKRLNRESKTERKIERNAEEQL
jgi:hypothetical protein